MSYNACVGIYYAKARLKKWVFKGWQKDVVFVEAWMEAGRLFHTTDLDLIIMPQPVTHKGL